MYLKIFSLKKKILLWLYGAYFSNPRPLGPCTQKEVPGVTPTILGLNIRDIGPTYHRILGIVSYTRKNFLFKEKILSRTILLQIGPLSEGPPFWQKLHRNLILEIDFQGQS